MKTKVEIKDLERILKKTKIVKLWQRQKGLDNQSEFYKQGIEIYDHRTITTFNKTSSDQMPSANSCGKQETWFFLEDTFSESKNIINPIIKYKQPIVVSGYYRVGRFRYSCQADLDSDEEFFAYRTSQDYLNDTVSMLEDDGASKIMYGYELEKEPTIRFIENAEEKVRNDFIGILFSKSDKDKRIIIENLLKKVKDYQ